MFHSILGKWSSFYLYRKNFKIHEINNTFSFCDSNNNIYKLNNAMFVVLLNIQRY